MRRILSLSLLASPLLFTAAAVAAPAAAANANPAQVRISTGVTAPRVISAPEIKIPETLRAVLTNEPTYKVKLTVTADGKVENAHIISSANHYLDSTVLATVAGYQWAPATLDDQKVAMDVTLDVVVAR